MAKAPAKTAANAKAAAAPRINIGISDKDRAAIAKGLSHVLADTYTLYLTTHNFHWNVTGPMFNTLHLMFMGQYTELWNAVDPIAERIRSLGHVAPGSYAQFGKLASLPDAPATPPRALEMVRILVTGHEAVARTARELFPMADKVGDDSGTFAALSWPVAAPVDSAAPSAPPYMGTISTCGIALAPIAMCWRRTVVGEGS